jgi:formate-dependent nitrite reductase membrane component NrfD
MQPQASHFWADKKPGEDLYALSERPQHTIPAGAREVYDVPHMIPWGHKIATYLWSKSIAAGVLLLAALFLNMDFEQDDLMLNFFSPVVALIFLTATMLLLVFDLKKPIRFIYLLTKPNFDSWLVLGGYVLILYGILACIWLGQRITAGTVSRWVVWSTALFAIASAGYSAFLFAQARGRDFWQSPLLFWHLLVQAIAAGAAMLTLMGSVVGVTLPLFYWLGNILIVALLMSAAMIFVELFMKHGSEDSVRAARLLTKGALSKSFWIFVIGIGTVLPLLLILWPLGSLMPNLLASALALFGLWMYESLWIKAGQAVPLS